VVERITTSVRSTETVLVHTKDFAQFEFSIVMCSSWEHSLLMHYWTRTLLMEREVRLNEDGSITVDGSRDTLGEMPGRNLRGTTR